MITKYSFVRRKPIKLTDGSVDHDVFYSTHIYFFGIRIFKQEGAEKIDCEMVPENKLTNNKVGFKKP